MSVMSLAYSSPMDRWRTYAELSAAGLAFVAAVMIGLFAGQWLDGMWGSGAVFTLLLMALALVGAIINLMRVLRRISERR